jgi:uncharacterized protein YjbJ (UPF0337 family)
MAAIAGLTFGRGLSQQGSAVFTPQQYRAKATEYAEFVKTANNPDEVREFQGLERSFSMLADNAQWLSDNHDKTVHREPSIDAVVLVPIPPTHGEDTAMDRDRIKGSAEQAKGAVKEVAGKILGDKKLETEGKTDKAVGKLQNAVGGLKDAVRGK